MPKAAKRLNPQFPGWYFFIVFVIHLSNQQYEEAWRDAQMIHTNGLIWQPIIRAALPES